jgi:hypothetical protein
MERSADLIRVRDIPILSKFGLSPKIIASGVTYTHKLLDSLDAQLIYANENRLAELLELANLSAVIGNLLRGGIAKASHGKFEANGPHKYPDLIATHPSCHDIEIKVALETNKPKGHLVKPGPHLACRYVLGQANGDFKPGKENRGNVVWIWEIRVGFLEDGHFNISNTAGDSGKTAVINAKGMKSLIPVYCDLDKCPNSRNSPTYRQYKALFEKSLFDE